MAKQLNFREMVDAARFRGLRADEQPRTMLNIATICGISYPHLYSLIWGKKTPQSWTVVKIARGLGVSEKVLNSALERSRKDCTSASSK